MVDTAYIGDALHEVMGRSYPSLEAEAAVSASEDSEGGSGQIVICYLPNSKSSFDAAVFSPSGNSYYIEGSLLPDMAGWLDFAKRHYYWITKDPQSTPEGRVKGRILAKSKKKRSEIESIDFSQFLDIADRESGGKPPSK